MSLFLNNMLKAYTISRSTSIRFKGFIKTAMSVNPPRPEDIHIPLDKLDYSFAKSSGPGGQNVNKVNTKAEVRYIIIFVIVPFLQ